MKLRNDTVRELIFKSLTKRKNKTQPKLLGGIQRTTLMRLRLQIGTGKLTLLSLPYCWGKIEANVVVHYQHHMTEVYVEINHVWRCRTVETNQSVTYKVFILLSKFSLETRNAKDLWGDWCLRKISNYRRSFLKYLWKYRK